MIRVSASTRAATCVDRQELDVRNRDVRPREVVGEHVRMADLDADTVSGRVLARDGDGGLVHVERSHRREPELRRRDREHAGSAAEVGEASARSVE